MTGVIQPLPFGPGAGAAPRVIDSRVIRIHHRTLTFPAGANVQVTNALPYPAVITHLRWHWTTVTNTTARGGADLYLSNNDSRQLDDATLGTKLTDGRMAGTSPPDFVDDAVQALHNSASTHFADLQVFWPVNLTPAYLKTRAVQNVAGESSLWLWVTLLVLDRPIGEGVELIPRGTEADPMCVKICEPFPFAPAPGTPPPTTGEPPPPTGVPQPLGTDPLAEPLPMACMVDPEFPLASLANACELSAPG